METQRCNLSPHLPTSVLSMSPVRTDCGIGQVGVFSCSKAGDLLPAVSLGGPGVGERAEPQDAGHAGASASQSHLEPGQRGWEVPEPSSLTDSLVLSLSSPWTGTLF